MQNLYWGEVEEQSLRHDVRPSGYDRSHGYKHQAFNTVTVSNWVNPDLLENPGYVSTYMLRHQNQELFTVHLNQQLGFYQISEFVAPAESGNFIIEQTNKAGKPKIVAFDKQSGDLLGTFKGNTLVNDSDEPVLEVKPLTKLEISFFFTLGDIYPEDSMAVNLREREIAAFFYRLPRDNRKRPGIFGKLNQWLKRGSDDPQDVMEMHVFSDRTCDLRMFCAMAVILHSRDGLHLAE